MPTPTGSASLAQPPLPAATGEVARKSLPAGRSSAPTAKARRTFGISLYKAWCKHCGICAEFCPTHALLSDEWGNPYVADEARCVGCLQCMHRCPDFCVEVYERMSLGADEGISTTPRGSEHEGE